MVLLEHEQRGNKLLVRITPVSPRTIIPALKIIHEAITEYAASAKPSENWRAESFTTAERPIRSKNWQKILNKTSIPGPYPDEFTQIELAFNNSTQMENMLGKIIPALEDKGITARPAPTG